MGYYLGMAALAFVGVLVVFAVFVATRPGAFRIERKGEVGADAGVVFGMINDFRQWREWSPWEGMDPAMTRTYSGAEAGVGAVYGWQGNKKVGEGRMTIEESVPVERVSIRLEFLKPFVARNQAIFTLTPVAGGTRVVWAMEGKRNFVMKGFCVFMDMDSLVGKDFEKGLVNMKKVAAGAGVV